MFLVSTLRSYAEPLIDKVGCALTENARAENHAVAMRLSNMEEFLALDFELLDKKLRELQRRVDLMEEFQVNASETISRIQQRIINIESNDRRLPTTATDKDIQMLRARIVEAEERLKETSHAADVATLAKKDQESEKDAEMRKLAASLEETTGQLEPLKSHLGRLETNITELAREAANERNDREKSKRKSFLIRRL